MEEEIETVVSTLSEGLEFLFENKFSGLMKRLAKQERHEMKNFFPQLTVLVGIPGSGKTTWALEQAELDPELIVLSSDTIRKELFGDEDEQDRNVELFQEITKRAREAVASNHNVIFDATNLSRRKRIHFLSHFNDDVYKTGVFFNVNLKVTEELCAARGRFVSSEVIERMHRSTQIPVLGEGFDTVEIKRMSKPHGEFLILRNNISENFFDKGEYDHEEWFSVLRRVHPDFLRILNLAQDSSYHPFSVSRHTYHVYRYVFDRYTGVNRAELLAAALFHDVGKAETKNFLTFKGEPAKYANFRGHENVSAQIVYEALEGCCDEFLDIDLVSTLCQFHMLLHDENYKHKKLIKLVGQETYELLVVLNKADAAGK